MIMQRVEGSEKWGGKTPIPDEYAIQHVGAKSDGIVTTLAFRYVKKQIEDGGVFTKHIGVIKIYNKSIKAAEGIIVRQSNPRGDIAISLKFKNRSSYGGGIYKDAESLIADNKKYKPLNFSNVFYYSAKKYNRQKSDENAPEWLKDFARENDANVAYFEF